MFHPDDIIGLVAILMIFGMPMVGMLLKHQRKMAEMFQAQARFAPDPEVQALRAEVRELRTLVNEQTIVIDGLARPLPSEARLQERVR